VERRGDVITLRDILRVEHVDLGLGAMAQASAVQQVLGLLRGDERVVDWGRLTAAISAKATVAAEGAGFEICIPHARTDAVNAMVMGVGRCESVPGKTTYLFVIGVPVALAADYLRIIGALARTFRDGVTEGKLRATDDAAEFVRLLADREMRA
jgi:mannitol/fructose-specific phosphotransferase system IIA component (Ntr-type)